MYTHMGEPMNILPLSLDEALSSLAQDTNFQHQIGGNLAAAFLKLKQEEWTTYLQHYSIWERENCIDL